MHAEGGDHPHPKVTVRALCTANNTWVVTGRMGNVDRGDDSVDMLVVQSEDQSAERGESRGGGISTETETKAESWGLGTWKHSTRTCSYLEGSPPSFPWQIEMSPHFPFP